LVDHDLAKGASDALTADPLVSIVLPTFNGSRYLAESIESCLAQTYATWELIIVDDCSTDETPRLIEHYEAKDSRIRSIRNERNLKLPASLNVGFSEANGALFTWTSDDNLYRPDALRAMVSEIQSPDAPDLVYAHQSVIDENGEVVDEFVALPPDDICMRNPINACFLYRRQVHEELRGYDEQMFLMEDWDFWIRTAEKFKLRLIDKNLYLYRRHPSSLTATRIRTVLEMHYTVLDKHLPRMRWVPRSNRAAAHVDLANHALTLGNRRGAGKHVLRALALNPVEALRHGKAALVACVFGIRAATRLSRRKL
jgi:glycosyltransferase involved in cell wall biosynthesis